MKPMSKAAAPVVRRLGKRVALFCNDPSKAIQSQKEEADINTIIRNFGLTGTVNQAAVPPTYGDFSGVDDYRTALEAVKAAEAAFLSVPANIRERFHHDPGAFLEFVENPANLEQLRAMGLAKPAPVPEGTPQSSS